MAEKRRGLGRGLSALIDEASPAEGSDGTAAAPTLLPIASIVANPRQPRRHFDAAAMDELVASIRARGVLQPILVRPVGGGSNGAGGGHARYEIVAGERRWRAAQAAQLHEMPVVVRELDDAAAFEIALVENIQRKDLNPIEEAEGFRRLIDDFRHTQESLAGIVGKGRSHVANLVRLLDLPPAVRDMVADGRLTPGHAKVLVGKDDPLALAEHIVHHGLSVRQIELMGRGGRRHRRGPKPPRPGLIPDADTQALETRLAEALGMPVMLIMTAPPSGTLGLTFSTFDQLDLLCRLLEAQPA